MKFLSILLLFVGVLGLSAQSDITPTVSEALKTGNAEMLGKHFSSNIDLTLPDEEDVFAKDQATKLVANFFGANSPSGFKVIHRGTSKLNDHYRIGELSTSSGLYRVTFFMKKEGKAFKISQFRIEESDE